MSITLFKKQVQESSLAEQVYKHQIKNDEVETKNQQLAKPRKTFREIRKEAERKNQEKVLLRKVKKHPQWKQRGGDKSHSANSTGSVGTGQHKSQLDRIYQKEQKLKEIDEVKKQVKKETIQKSQISSTIHSILMSRLKK